MAGTSSCIVRGSINYDEYFYVDHIARPGETISSTGYARRIGGKGANQAVAIARAGGDVRFVGTVGTDGQPLKERIAAEGVDVSGLVVHFMELTGRAIIQVDTAGENSIILLPGANLSFLCDKILAKQHAGASPCTHLLLQNEVQLPSTLAAIAATATAADTGTGTATATGPAATADTGTGTGSAPRPAVTVIFNPSPMPPPRVINVFPWHRVAWLIVNEYEAQQLHDVLVKKVDDDKEDDKEDDEEGEAFEGVVIGKFKEYDFSDAVLHALGATKALAGTSIVCTLGAQGVLVRLAAAYWREVAPGETPGLIYVRAAKVRGDVFDTTGAGDCFAGYFVKGLMDLGPEASVGKGVGVREVEAILRTCVVAAGMCVEKKGTIDSLPTQAEVAQRMLELSSST